MSATQVTTWRRYTKAQKKAYHERMRRQREGVRSVLINGRRVEVSRCELRHGTFHFADNLGSHIPTPRPRSEFL